MKRSTNFKLILFTLSFPFYKGKENTFLHHEVEKIQQKFGEFVIIPSLVGGNKQHLSSEIKVDISLANHLIHRGDYNCLSKSLSALRTSLFYKDNIRWPPIIFKPRYLNTLITYVHKSLIVKKWILNYINDNNLKNERTIFYTYWFTYVTTGIAIAIKNHKNHKLITRAHGVDLYIERNNGYIPCRKQTIEYLDRFYSISQFGKNYLQNMYPAFTTKYMVSRLGVSDPGFITKSSNDSIFRIVSCSSIISLKRIDLLFMGLIELANRFNKRNFLWTHIGSGRMENEIKNLIQKASPINLSCNLLGTISNEKVFEFYRYNCIDIFINVSQTEGIPVSVMEAQSCGIPVIGTNVGGMAEIINDNVGRLISSNPKPKEIANALACFLNEPSKLRGLKKNSKFNWKTNFNEKIAFRSFLDDLCLLYQLK